MSQPLFPKPLIMPGQHSTAEPHAALIASPCWSPGPVPQIFRFRSRTEPMDWRRMSVLDVDRVAREMDVSALQEFISAVTFCDVAGERCPHCRGPTDGALLKVLRMSQLSTEYLLHCQGCLSTQVSTLEEQLQGALSQAQHAADERAQLEKELQEVKLENRRRKKMLATQQLLLQASANNYHKCQFCEKSFVNYSYLQSHVQRRHPEITEAERQKKRQVEQMEDGIEELKEKLRLTQSYLAAEREADARRRQQEAVEQQRREEAEREMVERWKQEERRKFHQEIEELQQLFLQKFKDMANKSSSIEAKLQELESRETSMPNLRSEDDHNEEQRWIREKELKHKMAQKKNEWRTKLAEMQNRHQQEKEQLRSENARLQKALFVEQSSSSSLSALKQQVTSLSSQLTQKDRLINTQDRKIKKLSARSLSEPPIHISQNVLDAAEEDDDDDDDDDNEEEEEERLEDLMEAQRKVLESLRENPDFVKEFRPIMEEVLEKRLEKMGLRKGTKGISKQTLKSLSSGLSAQRAQGSSRLAHLQDLRENLVLELNRRVRQNRGKKNGGKSVGNTLAQRPAHSHRNTLTQLKKQHGSLSMDRTPKPRLSSSTHSPQQTPIPAPRCKASPRAHTPQAHHTKSSTPPFSSEEDVSAEDSAYITSSRGKPSPSTQLKPPTDPREPGTELDWSDSEASSEPEGLLARQAAATHGSVVQTLTRSLERQLNDPKVKPTGGTRVLPPAPKPSLRPSIIKQQAVSIEESDLELSSIEELFLAPTPLHRSSDTGGTSGTSVWSTATSRGRGW
ncbi:zinc finger protein DZIP1L [Electrophorus electricus]|uniref:zinc finger protein DZIP1L n=1 Tax=Electrophorus electricus TaxID=8005 RepID=UPI0015D00396|nr:zinc finger protein DZIP1L [Electrophorus electricus]